MRFVELAEGYGFRTYHVAEHHHAPLCMAPSQSVYLASVAQRTKRLRFGPLVHVLPMYHPIRLIEEICMVDHLSGGRYEVGVGAGTGRGAEFALWGGEATEHRERFEEILEILRKGLQSDRLDHHGKYFEFTDLPMELRPVQEPHPPFWFAGNPESAARRGANFVGVAITPERVGELVATYLRVSEEEARNPRPWVVPPREPLFGGTKRMFIAETDDEARERGRAAYRSYCEHFEEARQYVDPDIRASLPQLADPERALDIGVILAGSPETVRQFALQYRESGANYFVADFHWGDLTHEEAVNSMRLFAQDVMPAFG
jgi:alkanesulfonate monooxygenase SsuD/methylene tetrahydromethanopterin reductase-like flavin-dependent oxidoreductase (luciferase family)